VFLSPGGGGGGGEEANGQNQGNKRKIGWAENVMGTVYKVHWQSPALVQEVPPFQLLKESTLNPSQSVV
jgi:hypothetical protein